jgi:hypothetical protein
MKLSISKGFSMNPSLAHAENAFSLLLGAEK